MSDRQSGESGEEEEEEEEEEWEQGHFFTSLIKLMKALQEMILNDCYQLGFWESNNMSEIWSHSWNFLLVFFRKDKSESSRLVLFP